MEVIYQYVEGYDYDLNSASDPRRIKYLVALQIFESRGGSAWLERRTHNPKSGLGALRWEIRKSRVRIPPPALFLPVQPPDSILVTQECRVRHVYEEPHLNNPGYPLKLELERSRISDLPKICIDNEIPIIGHEGAVLPVSAVSQLRLPSKDLYAFHHRGPRNRENLDGNSGLTAQPFHVLGGIGYYYEPCR